MKNTESLMKKAKELKAKGLVEGQIAEELEYLKRNRDMATHSCREDEHCSRSKGYLSGLVDDRQERL